MPLSELSAWQVQQLRLTAFVQQNDRAKEEGWWSSLFGAPAETRTVRANEGLLQDEGPFKDGRIVLSVLPGRVDWIWSTIPGADIDKGTLSSLGNLADTAKVFGDLMNAWFGLALPFSRLAFGTILDQPVPDKQSAYRLLQEYLQTVRIFPESSSDFMYQINRPVESKVLPGYRINRLSKWAALRAIMMAGQGGKPAAVRHEYSAVRLETDVNTFSDANAALPKEKSQDSLLELISITQAIAEKGDQSS